MIQIIKLDWTIIHLPVLIGENGTVWHRVE